MMKKEDLEVLASIYALAYNEANVGETWDKKSARKILQYFFEKQPDLAFVAEYENKIVGAVLSGIKPWCDGNHLFDGELFVHPDFQKYGIARALMKELCKTAREKYDAVIFDGIIFKDKEFPLEWYKYLESYKNLHLKKN